ncbi:MAG: Tn3 family transposase [Saprospiraceae bacterium]
MAAIHETAYPRFKSHFEENELVKFYSPTPEEVKFSKKYTRSLASQFGLLTHLKVFQRLGYFVLWDAIPPPVTKYISTCLGNLFELHPLHNYDESGTRNRHLDHIRKYMEVKSVGDATTICFENAAKMAVQTKEHISDIINVMIEELIRQNFELPGFSTIDRAAYKIRFQFNEQCFENIAGKLKPNQISKIEHLLASPKKEEDSKWYLLKQEPSKPTVNTVKSYAAHVDALLKWQELLTIKIDLPAAKHEQFSYEAYAADLAHINQLALKKRYAYAVMLVKMQTAKATDNLVALFIKQIKRLHNKASAALELFKLSQVENATDLVEQLLKVTQAFQGQGSAIQRFAAIEKVMPNEPQNIVDKCQNHLAVSQNNEFFFLPKLYKSKRFVLFNCLMNFRLDTSSQQRNFKKCVDFLRHHQFTKKEFLETEELDLSWISDKWRKLVTRKTTRQSKVALVNRRFFELCVFTELSRQLQSGDVYIDNSLEYDDYTRRYISWKEYEQQIPEYETLSGIPTDPPKFINHLKKWMSGAAKTMNDGFTDNQYVRLENGSLVVSPVKAVPQDEDYQFLDEQLKKRMGQTGILDILTRSEKWLNLSKGFGQLSGYESRLDNYPARFISTLFCYGCNFGPSEAARSIAGVTRKQLAWINAHHVTEKRLEKAIDKVINQYNKFQLPNFWGTGKTAAADGTKWDLYEQNLISEYHIRYGSYGGIAYYHVSDTYIALFSHFIPCGVYEAIYILDGLMKNQSDIQPNIIHGDTHAQSFPVFGLAYLLGIQLMPRIKKNKVLTMYQPDKATDYPHIAQIFNDPINWKLIQTHLPDMLRVALSVKAGKLTPSAILRKLGSHSRKNKLYYAFRELGRAVRTGFLLQYYHDVALRKTINAATNKCEEFNNFTKWTAFVNKGEIRENLKHEQIKIIKYNHLVANLLIFYNTQEMTRVLKELTQEGYQIKKSTLQALSPYRTEHINRFGYYPLNMNQEVPPLNIDFQLFV